MQDANRKYTNFTFTEPGAPSGEITEYPVDTHLHRHP